MNNRVNAITKIKDINWGTLTEHRSQLMGVLAIGIVFYHFCLDGLSVLPVVFKPFGMYGNCISDAFLFLAGVSSFFAIKKSTSVGEYYKKRIRRVWFSFVIYCLPFIIFYNVFAVKSIDEIFYDCLLITLYNKYNQMFWYVPTIMICYFFVPLIYKTIENKRGFYSCFLGVIIVSIVFCLLNNELFTILEIGITRIPVFMLGLYSGMFVQCKKKYSRGIGSIIVSLFVVLCVYKGILLAVEYYKNIEVIWAQRYWMGVVGYFIIIILSVLLHIIPQDEKTSKILGTIGSYSFEIYIVHMFFRFLVSSYIGNGMISELLLKYSIIVVSTIIWIKVIDLLKCLKLVIFMRR